MDEHAFTEWEPSDRWSGYYARCRCLHEVHAPTVDELAQLMGDHLLDAQYERDRLEAEEAHS